MTSNILIGLLGLTKLKLITLKFVGVGLLMLGSPVTKMHATTFGPAGWDQYNSGGFACLQKNRPNKQAIKYMNAGAIVAHRKLPCWSEVLLRSIRMNRSELAVVADRGPYGRNSKGIDVYDGFPWSRGIASRLRLNGNESIHVIPTGRILASEMKKVPNGPTVNY